MISASKYQHIIYFMSLLKVSLSINRPKQRLLCMDTRRGCRSKRSPIPWKNKNIFFSYMGGLFATSFPWGGLYTTFFSLWSFFFHNKDALLLLFLYVEGLFTTSSSWCGAFFTMWGPFLLFFSLCGGENTTFMGDFMSLWFFYGLAPSPYKLFCGRMLLCNFLPMSSAITYSGHYVPNKAHCNTRVQFTITMKKCWTSTYM